MHDVTLDPHLWLTLEAGDQARLERWLVSEGDVVGEIGQHLAYLDRIGLVRPA